MKFATALLAALLAAGALCGQDAPNAAPGGRFKWKNPISGGIIGGTRDCQVFKANGKWHMTGTSPEFFKGPNPGVRLYSSENLSDWKDEGLLIDRSKLDPSVWYYDRFWAPEIQKIDGRWYLAVSCCNESKEFKHDFGCCLAVSDSLEGPYEIITKKEPLAGGIDMSFFHENGKTYGFWCGISMCEVDLKAGKLVGKPKIAVPLSKDPDAWDSYRGVEGPWCFKRDGKYYLFYSSFTRGYEVGYATADSIEGPWTKAAGNPIYGEIDPWVYEGGHKKGQPAPAKNTPGSPFIAAGHNAVFEGPDGKPWICCHGIAKGKGPLLCIDPLKFGENGEILFSGPSFEPQETLWKK